jgi:hypothetical protein
MADQVSKAKEQLQRAREVQAADFWHGHITRGNAREHEQQTTARKTAVETARQQRLTQ